MINDKEFRNMALCDARNVLREEANVLALLLDKDTFDNLPHRVSMAVRSEMTRLRCIADALEGIDEQLRPEITMPENDND